jgi:N-acetylglutamate synthase-like GNAT family acetyltransferase
MNALTIWLRRMLPIIYCFLKNANGSSSIPKICEHAIKVKSASLNFIVKDSVSVKKYSWQKPGFVSQIEEFLELTPNKIKNNNRRQNLGVVIQEEKQVSRTADIIASGQHSQKVREYLQQSSRDTKRKSRCFTASLGTEAISCVVTLSFDHYAIVIWITTKPSYRDRGIAQNLTHFAVKEAFSSGMKKVFVRADVRMSSFFKKLGFIKAESLKSYRLERYHLRGKMPAIKRVRFNDVLKTKDDFKKIAKWLDDKDLPKHIDPPKNWDSYSALSIIINHLRRVSKNKRILDAGGEYYPSILKLLDACGFDDLTSINIVYKDTKRITNITYEFGDITSTRFKPNYFDAIVCLSVIEHGVDINKYLQEMYRILKPGGILITFINK